MDVNEVITRLENIKKQWCDDVTHPDIVAIDIAILALKNVDTDKAIMLVKVRDAETNMKMAWQELGWEKTEKSKKKYDERLKEERKRSSVLEEHYDMAIETIEKVRKYCVNHPDDSEWAEHIAFVCDTKNRFLEYIEKKHKENQA